MKKSFFYGLLMLCLMASITKQRAQAQVVIDPEFLNLEDVYIETNPLTKRASNLSTNGGVFTPKGTIRCMVIYAGFYIPGDDAFNTQNVSKWPSNDIDDNYTTVPTFAEDNFHDLLFSNVADLNNPAYANVPNLTRYYNEMSHGKFTIVGNVFSDPTTGEPVRINIDPTGTTSN